MLIISRLSVLLHKHPHELLDSVVKEQLVKSFVSTEARILQQPHLSSSSFENFFSTSTACASDQPQSLVSGRRILQRSKTLSTTFLTRLRSTRPKHQQDQPSILSARRILLESAASATSIFAQPFVFQRVLLEACTASGAHYRPSGLTVNTLFGFQANSGKSLRAGLTGEASQPPRL